VGRVGRAEGRPEAFLREKNSGNNGRLPSRDEDLRQPHPNEPFRTGAWMGRRMMLDTLRADNVDPKTSKKKVSYSGPEKAWCRGGVGRYRKTAATSLEPDNDENTGSGVRSTAYHTGTFVRR